MVVAALAQIGGVVGGVMVKQLDEFSDSYQVTANVANVLLNPFRQMAAQLAARFQDHACTRTKKVVGRGGRVRDDSR